MENHAVTHAKQVNAFFLEVFAVVDPFNEEMIVDRLNGLLESDAMVTPVCGSLLFIPIKRLLFQRVLAASTKVNCLASSFPVII